MPRGSKVKAWENSSAFCLFMVALDHDRACRIGHFVHFPGRSILSGHLYPLWLFLVGCILVDHASDFQTQKWNHFIFPALYSPLSSSYFSLLVFECSTWEKNPSSISLLGNCGAFTIKMITTIIAWLIFFSWKFKRPRSIFYGVNLR